MSVKKITEMRVLLTGAAGSLGQVVSKHFLNASADQRPAQLCQTDLTVPCGANGDWIALDLSNRDELFELVQGYDAIIHLGGISSESDWDSLLSSNIVGAINLWDAALAAGVDRIIYASSNHATGLYSISEKIGPKLRCRPDSRYGITKVFGENLAELYATKSQLRTLCIRIGSSFPKPTHIRHIQTFFDYSDLITLIQKGLTADYRFKIVYGASQTDNDFWTTDEFSELGYSPALPLSKSDQTGLIDDHFSLQGGDIAERPLAADWQGPGDLTFIVPVCNPATDLP